MGGTTVTKVSDGFARERGVRPGLYILQIKGSLPKGRLMGDLPNRPSDDEFHIRHRGNGACPIR